MVVFSCS
jgi:hypothetical protein